MSKIGMTKNRILDIISSGNKTTSDISRELGLDISTVSQHIKELKSMGALEEVKSEHFKKWKSYRLSPNFNYSDLAITKETQGLFVGKNKAIIALAALGIVSVLLYALLSLRAPFGTTPGGNLVQIAITDPPSVPEGTSALYLNYSSVSIYITENGTSEWITSDSNGTLDLLALVNVSQVIARFRLPQNSAISLVSLKINSERIKINGNDYGVLLHSGNITTSVLSYNYSPGSEVLVDLSPTIIPMYLNGKQIFVMSAQAGSVLLQNATEKVSQLSSEQRDELNTIESNLTISNPSITVDNSSMALHLTITNTGTHNFLLRSILLLGGQLIVNETGYHEIIPSVPVSQNHMGAQFIIENNGTLQFANPQYLNDSFERINL